MAAKIIAVVSVVVVVLVGLVIATASVGVDRLNAVDNGVDHFSGAERLAADDALLSARIACGSEPGQRIVNRKWRVVELEIIGDQSEGRWSSQGLLPNYRAEMQSYTLFGIPILKIEVRPNESIYCVEGTSDQP
jgi:hypothetical protein